MVQLYLQILNGFSRLDERLHRDDEGATAVEYGLMVALIAAVIVVAVGTLGGHVRDIFNNVATAVGNAAP